MCGKDATDGQLVLTGSGSPPRVRERHFGVVKMEVPNRITPACAGKTNGEKLEIWEIEDHPRVCGKDVIPETVGQDTGGSPPRVRERLDLLPPKSTPTGITPACAGKTKIKSLSATGL